MRGKILFSVPFGLLLFSFLLILSMNSGLYSDEMEDVGELMYDQHLKLILKILSYDKNFNRYGNPIRIGVSSQDALDAFSALEEKVSIYSKRFEVKKMNSPQDISRFKVIYVDRNWEKHYRSVAKECKEYRVLMFCRDEKNVRKGNGAFSFKYDEYEEKTFIILNLNAAFMMGGNFDLEEFVKIRIPIVAEIGR